MTEQEVAKVLYLLNVNYKYDSKTTAEEMERRLKLWAVEFREEDARLVERAVHIHIQTNRYYPNIADIKNIIGKLKEELSVSTAHGGGVVVHIGNRTWIANDVSQVKVTPEQEAYLDNLWNDICEA